MTVLNKVLLNVLTDDMLSARINNTFKQCVRSSNERDKCTLCIDICPEEAITGLTDSVVVDPLICSGCNLCVSSCYGRNFSSEKKPYLKTLNSILENKESMLTCMKSENTSNSINFGCTRTIDRRFLAAFLTSGIDHRLILDHSNCNSCEYETLSDQEFFDDLINFGDLISKIELRTDDEEPEDLSRRDLFKQWRSTLEDVTKSSIEQSTKILEQIGIDKNNRENIDSIINILIEAGLSKGNNLDEVKDYIYQIAIKDDCIMCNQCILKCPSGALKSEKSDTHQSIRMDINKCNFCGRCIEVCPSDSIYKQRYQDKDEVVLQIKELQSCKLCKGTGVSLDDNGYCLSCSIRRKNRNKFKLV